MGSNRPTSSDTCESCEGHNYHCLLGRSKRMRFSRLTPTVSYPKTGSYSMRGTTQVDDYSSPTLFIPSTAKRGNYTLRLLLILLALLQMRSTLRELKRLAGRGDENARNVKIRVGRVRPVAQNQSCLPALSVNHVLVRPYSHFVSTHSLLMSFLGVVASPCSAGNFTP